MAHIILASIEIRLEDDQTKFNIIVHSMEVAQQIVTHIQEKPLNINVQTVVPETPNEEAAPSPKVTLN